MGLFRRPSDRDRWDQSPRRYRQPEYESSYEGTYSEDARRARPGERGLGWARRRDIDDRMSQQAAPRGGGRYDRSGEERYAEGLEEFEDHEGYRAQSPRRWELDEGGVQFGAGRFADGERFGRDEYRQGGYARGDDGHGGWSGERSGPFRGMGPRGYQRSDERVRDDVCDLLTDDEHIDASDVTVEVSAGVVVLGGTVDSRASKRRAEDLVESVSGVREVQNNLRVPSQPGQFSSQQGGGTFGSSAQAGSAASSAAGGAGETSDKSRR